jgi:hypothetical protein
LLRGVVQQHLLGQRREERLGDGVIEARADRTHTLLRRPVESGLAAAVGVSDELAGGGAA